MRDRIRRELGEVVHSVLAARRNGSLRVVTTATVPQTSPETITGAATEDCTPIARI